MFMMMHTFGFGFGGFWLLLPLAIILIGRLHRGRQDRYRHGSSSIDDGAGWRRGERGTGTSDAAIYRLAARLGGRITVSDVVIETGIGTEEAEAILRKMTDGIRVRMEVDERGIIWYEFSELGGRSSTQ